ncbi:hypothetical protein DIE23_05035 [Burkholderia sp. Bp9143]|nr:hypothetical protein DIE23_05035 [Burkholderia sp. Bp9143]
MAISRDYITMRRVQSSVFGRRDTRCRHDGARRESPHPSVCAETKTARGPARSPARVPSCRLPSR